MVAKIIAGQLGISTLALLGASILVDLGDGLEFGIKGCRDINLIQIILDPSDTYTVRFCRIESVEKNTKGLPFVEVSWRLVSSHSDIYCDMLHDLIEEQTGLLTRFTN